MTLEEQEDALQAVCGHFGLPVLLMVMDGIIDKMKTDAMSIGISEDPQKAGMQLLKERMKYEGAMALKMALREKIKDIKTRGNALHQRSN